MSFTLKYVGKKSELVGKTLWEILGNLKDFGVGRIILRNSLAARYPEPCYYRILEVTAQPNTLPPKMPKFRPPNDLRDKDHPRTVHALFEMVHRGAKFERPILIRGESCLPDYSLVPKHLEKNYKFSKTQHEKVEENVLPQYIEFPPLLKNMLIKNGAKDPKLKMQIRPNENSLYRLAQDGEQPTKQVETGFGTAKSQNLLKGVNYDI